MKYKIIIGLLSTITAVCYMVLGVLLVTYYDIDITSNLAKLAEVLK